MATRAELQVWTAVELPRAKGRAFNEQCRWMEHQGLESMVDFVYVPSGSIGDRGNDIFKFKNPSMATLFKLTFGGS